MPNIIDMNALDELRDVGGDDFVVEMIATFLDETPGLIEQLQQAYTERNADVFRRMAHSIKSSSRTLGGLQLSAMAVELESLAKGNRLDDAGKLIPSFIAEFESVKTELTRIASANTG